MGLVRCENCERYEEKRESEFHVAVIKGVEMLVCRRCWDNLIECSHCHKDFEEDAVIYEKELNNYYCKSCSDYLNERFNIEMKEMREDNDVL